MIGTLVANHSYSFCQRRNILGISFNEFTETGNQAVGNFQGPEEHMKYYEKYISYLESEGIRPETLDGLRLEATETLANDVPEKALTIVGQMAAAMLVMAKRQNPVDCQIVEAINNITDLMVDYLTKMGWRFRAHKTDEGWRYEYLPL